ncbi:helix-turn-helix domain-containing protein [Saccharopolyspora phatthalungensis]|uniref:Transposase-like protein n=1 Tax=Saccharopolyspora phatthalungensis TaxID=664693 RepID=A0A840Q6L3_9PSEU|nr:helix-turn-helix domain-containing protein [Saccharopolyspora phatthalungensis]MBB5154348.1 transposase-like protein [Saccharopolyspora phatthalungensis]
MRRDSSLTVEQRAAAIELFGDGWARKAVATRLGASVWAVGELYDRWRLRGGAALVSKPTKRAFSFEFKLKAVQRFLAGETKFDLAREFDLSSPKLIETWARIYRNEGEEGLRPKRRGRPPRPAEAGSGGESELQALRRENERLRAENAYLGKLRALRTREQRRK